MVHTLLYSANGTLSNCSLPHHTEPSNFQIVTAILELVLLILVCFGNGLVIAAFYRARKLRTMTNYFIMNLSIADFCVGLVMPFHAALYFRPELLRDFHVCIFRYSSLMTMLCVSIFCLLALSYDRYSAITKPLRYHSEMSLRKTVVTILVVWLLPIIGIFVTPFFWNNSELFLISCDCDFATVLAPAYIQWIILPGFLLCTVVVLFFYIRIFLVARNHLDNIRRMESQLHAHNKFHKTLKTTQTAAIVLGVFFASWLPFMLIVAVQQYFQVRTEHIDSARTWATLLAVLNSAWNPIIYAFRMRGFKSEFKSMLHLPKTNSDLSSTFRRRLNLAPRPSCQLVEKDSDSSENSVNHVNPADIQLVGVAGILPDTSDDKEQYNQIQNVETNLENGKDQSNQGIQIDSEINKSQSEPQDEQQWTNDILREENESEVDTSKEKHSTINWKSAPTVIPDKTVRGEDIYTIENKLHTELVVFHDVDRLNENAS